MHQGEHSAIPSTFIKLPFVIKIFILSIFEWMLKTGFTVGIFIFSFHAVTVCHMFVFYRSEANDLALRLAKHYTKGTEVITLDQ